MPKDSTKSRSQGLRALSANVRVRLVMAGAFFGALVALALSVTFSWGAADGIGAKRVMVEQARQAFQAPAGSCLTWTKGDVSDIHKVDCLQPHFFEVTQVLDVSDKYPPGVPAPNIEAWREITQERCTEGAQTYLGKPLDPYGKLTVSALRPGAEDWQDGNRELRCVVQWAGPGGGLQKITGLAAEQQQANTWEVGTCLALLGKSVGDPTDCSQPHAYEIIATLDLKENFTGGYPSQADQKTWLDTKCNAALKEYAGDTDLAAQKLILGWDVREQESWDAGSTLVNCKVGAKLEDGSGLAPVTGSIKKSDPAASSAPPASSSAPSAGAPSSGAASSSTSSESNSGGN